MKKVYLAGFDVFAPDAKQRGVKMKMLCAGRGLIGLYPLDHEADGAEAIFRGNCGLIDQADAVIANLNAFRGREPDSGTCFEVGYAFAKGKKVYGYVSDARTMREKRLFGRGFRPAAQSDAVLRGEDRRGRFRGGARGLRGGDISKKRTSRRSDSLGGLCFYAPNRSCKRSRSAIIEINSLFVGLPLTPEMV